MREVQLCFMRKHNFASLLWSIEALCASSIRASLSRKSHLCFQRRNTIMLDVSGKQKLKKEATRKNNRSDWGSTQHVTNGGGCADHLACSHAKEVTFAATPQGMTFGWLLPIHFAKSKVWWMIRWCTLLQHTWIVWLAIHALNTTAENSLKKLPARLTNHN